MSRKTKHVVSVDQIFGRLKVVALKKIGRRLFVITLCKCGNVRIDAPNRLISGHLRSCGCIRIENARKMGLSTKKHGLHNSRVYHVWQGMKQRCIDPNSVCYHNYGGRGIKVCKRWMDFKNFLTDIGHPPEGMSLDRIDNNGDYCKENCRWTSMKKQSRNRRPDLYVEWQGRQRLFIELCEEFKINYQTAYSRLYEDRRPIEKVFDPTKHTFFRERNPRAKPFLFRGKMTTFSQLAREHNMGVSTLTLRLKAGWSLEEAISVPVSRCNKIRKIRSKSK